MKCEAPEQSALVSLPISLIEAMLKMRSALDDHLASALVKSVGGTPTSKKAAFNQACPNFAAPQPGKYAAEFLGVVFTTNTLPDVFGRVVDMMANVAPEALVKLAAIRTRGRRYVSRERRDIHPRSPHLPVTQTESGWWISKNISQDQLRQALRTLCNVSGLSFGKDLKFLLQ
jgi:hypothetical protein